MVEVGLGFFVEHTLPETLSWCDVKIEHINKRISKAETSSATLSARIKVLHDGIGQLLGVEPMEQKRRERESF
jgi:prefoldin subunit 5